MEGGGAIIDWGALILGILGLLLGGGITWIFTIKAMRRKADGESQQVVADSWKSVQDVYQQTIQDLNSYMEDIRNDRNHLREERDQQRAENDELRKRYIEMEEQIMELKKVVARQGRKIEALSPFLCGVVACTKRKKVEIPGDDSGLDEQEQSKDTI